MRVAVSSLVLFLLVLPGCDDDRGTGDAGGPGPGVDAGPLGSSDSSVPPGTDAGTSSTGGGAIGDACATDADCTDPPDAECFTTFENPFDGSIIASFPNGYCSKGCESVDDCGGGDVTCASGSMSGGMSSTMFMYCAPTCGDASECRADEGYRCQMIFGFGYCSP